MSTGNRFTFSRRYRCRENMEIGEHLQALCANATVYGASKVAPVPVQNIVVDPRVNFKCQVPRCENYGRSHMCPPRVMSAEEFSKVLARYTFAILVQISLPAKELGADRICNAVAAYAQYGSPCIFIDFGTATSFGALSGNGNFLGGCILTGVRLAREAVVTGTSKLPHFELNLPEKVINRTTITEVLNYPNPFTTNTRFVFTLTGSEIPTYMKIQIMTVTGKVVREVKMHELGPLRVGRNMTDFAWDGTDEFGDRLARGVYLYRVIAQLNGEDIEYRATGASGYFTKGFGKMYLLR